MGWYVIRNYGRGLQFHILQATEAEYEKLIEMHSRMKKFCGSHGGLYYFDTTKFATKEEAENECRKWFEFESNSMKELREEIEGGWYFDE